MTLAGFVARRAAGAVIFAFVVASIAMALAWLAPGDASTIEDFDQSPDQIAARRAALGLDRPWHEQYGRWVAGVVRLDLGRSSLYSRPVVDLVGERALNTAILALAALALATLIGVPLGRYTGVTHGWAARMARVASLVLLSIPPLIGSLLLVLIAARTGWAPVGGMPSGDLHGAAWLLALLRHLPVPVLALALPLAATLERLQARSMAEAAARPFVRASLARGRSLPDALRLHAWPVSLTPVLGVYGILVGALFSGSFVVESVTAWPGLGRLLMDALHARDVWLVAGCGAVGAALLATATFVVDVVHFALDPRALEER
jgi:peptide/nickel transport system permease protein